MSYYKEKWKYLDEHTSKEKIETANELLSSARGNYIIGQALAIAAEILSTNEHPNKEESNAADMKLLGETIFEAGWLITNSKKLIKKQIKEMGDEKDNTDT